MAYAVALFNLWRYNMFGKSKGKIKVDIKKKRITLIEVNSVEHAYSLITNYFMDNLPKEEDAVEVIFTEGAAKLQLLNDWTFCKKTVAKFNHKVNFRFRKINKATTQIITSTFNRV